MPLNEVNPSLPPELSRIIGQALEKDRDLRYQSATDLKTALKRLKRDLDSGRQLTDSSGFRSRPPSAVHEHSIAVLYFENLSGMKEDEYLRDGITEDITTELSKIKNLKTFSRAMVLAYRDKSVTAGQVGKELGASYVLVGSLRRAGTRLRINAQLVDAATDFPLWSERYDREMKDVFEVQDEIAQKIAAALRITLSPQEQQALSAKPTENLQAYDLYLRGRNYARRVGRQDLQVALQMYENAVALDPNFALAHVIREWTGLVLSQSLSCTVDDIGFSEGLDVATLVEKVGTKKRPTGFLKQHSSLPTMWHMCAYARDVDFPSVELKDVSPIAWP